MKHSCPFHSTEFDRSRSYMGKLFNLKTVVMPNRAELDYGLQPDKKRATQLINKKWEFCNTEAFPKDKSSCPLRYMEMQEQNSAFLQSNE